MKYINKNFYQEGQDEAGDESAKVKVGEREYSQEDLQKLVGLGETASELETKWNTKLDKVYPEFTKKSQRLAEIEPEFENLKKFKEEASRKPANEEVTPEVREKARAALFDILGGRPVFDSDFDKHYVQRRSAELLVEDAEKVLGEAKALGKPVTSKDELVQFMNETGIKNPEVAYKVKFESELDKWKEEQIKKIKPSGLQTQSSSTAGGKVPPPVKVTRDNLDQLLKEALNRE